MIRARCGCGRPAKLVRCVTEADEHCAWWCSVCECIVLTPEFDGAWLPREAVAAYIEAWDKTVEDLPEVVSGLSGDDSKKVDRLAIAISHYLADTSKAE